MRAEDLLQRGTGPSKLVISRGIIRVTPFRALIVAEKTYLSKELYIEIVIRSPKTVGLFGYR